MLLAILKFNYNVNYINVKKHTFILRGKLMCDSHYHDYYIFGKEG